MSTTTINPYRQKAAKVATLSRGGRSPYDPELLQARREWAESNLAAHITKVVAAAPPLTDEQKERLAALLNGAAA